MTARTHIKQGLMAFVLIASLGYAGHANALSASTAGQLLFKSDSDAVTLNGDMQMDVTHRLEEITASCSYPQTSRQDWKEKIFAPYGFQVRYETPKRITLHTYKSGAKGEVWEINEIMLPLEDDPAGSGVFVKTTDQKWTYLFKCDGKQMVDLVCKPELQKFYPEEGGLYQVACQNRVREIDQRDASLDLPSTDKNAEMAPAAGGSEICEPLEKAAGAARLLIPEALERIASGPETDHPVRAIEQEPQNTAKNTVENEQRPLIIPQKGSAFEIQSDEMIFQ